MTVFAESKHTKSPDANDGVDLVKESLGNENKALAGMLGSAGGGCECFDNGIDVVTHHFLVRVDIRAIGHQSLGEGDAGIAGQAGEDFMVGLLFGENRADILFMECFQEFGELPGARKLFAVESLDRMSGELVVLAEIAKGIMSRGEVALFFRDSSDLLTRPTIEIFEL